ncbi:MAG: DNA lyase [Proteobacteria bacterium]|nr:DNA lyase [Pseudomonadota bacterium]MBS0217164.1 DNA lyase [Pseudomonadota bacterium]
MRLWTLHPKFLDTKGLVALWRESLLAQAVIRGQTKGYKHHPQLIRFYEQDSPRYAINGFLAHVYAESLRRGYHFDKSKIGPTSASLAPMEATTGQLDYEWRHLLGKLRDRSPDTYTEVRKLKPEASPIFSISAGPVADWERP